MVSRPDVLVGRERELDALRAALEAARAAAGAVVLEGEAGIGKTALWEAALELAPAAKGGPPSSQRTLSPVIESS